MLPDREYEIFDCNDEDEDEFEKANYLFDLPEFDDDRWEDSEERNNGVT